jgi:glycosyltransferase involved in cell wall biosynthesis
LNGGSNGAGPMVSVIVPAYNRAAIVGETIANILQQTYPNMEVIVVDDGSTDATVEVLKSFGGKIRWTTQPNSGPAAARNRGIAMAQGEIIAFQDSDDAWHPSKIARQVSLLERAPEAVCCVCNCTIQLPGIVVQSFEAAPLKPSIAEGVWLNPAEVLATRFILFNQAVAVRREVLQRIGGFDESLRLMEDMDLALRLSIEGPWTFIREPLATRQDKLPRTLGHEANSEVLSRNRVKIWQGMVDLSRREKRFAPFRPIMERELKHAQRRRRAVELRESGSTGASVFGWGLERFERYRAAVERRTPWFPKMHVEPA